MFASKKREKLKKLKTEKKLKTKKKLKTEKEEKVPKPTHRSCGICTAYTRR
jgi:hypothetical protein